MNKQVLLIEDEPDISGLIQLHLGDIGVEITCIANGQDAWTHLQEERYDLLILDIMLPGMNGLDICKYYRGGNYPYTPILMLTSRAAEIDRVLGLELGADDYLTKPFSMMEMVARVKALLRRVDALSNNNDQASQQIRFDGLSIDAGAREVICEGNRLELTAREFELLYYFARHPGQVFSRSQLLDQVWGYGHEGYEHTVNSHINRLRSKLENNPRKPSYIRTVWGVGYQFIAETGK